MRRRSPIVAAIVAAVLLVAALSPSIYTLSIHVPQPLRGIAAAARPILAPLAGVMRGLLSDSGWTPSELVRKAYSVAGFAVLGYIVAHGMRRRRFNLRALATISIVAGFSAIIEILQRQAPDHESWLSSLLDIACGAAGGIIGAVVQQLWKAHRARSG